MLKACGELEISDDEKLGPYKEGDEMKLPYWQAKILVKENFAAFMDLKPIQQGDLNKILYRELPNPQLTSIDPNFYVKIHEDLVDLTEKYQKDQDILLFQKMEKIKSLFKDVTSRRFYKLLRLAATGVQEGPVNLENLSNEEKVLYESLRNILREWESRFL
jgi:DNA replication initiation complex subunit (GINS family)